MKNTTKQANDKRAGAVARRGRRRAFRLPLTAMIDVTFLLLLYFILTSMFRPDEGQLPGSLPASAGPAPILAPVRVAIRPTGRWGDGAIYCAERSSFPMTPPQELYRFLASKRQEQSPPLLLKVHGGVRWKYAVEAYNQALRADFDKIIFDDP
jgi:biopolymer transport protein ExbD